MHGVLSDSPSGWGQPALVLRGDDGGQSENGHLTMTDVMDLDLRAEIVALIACETGAGELAGGEGIMAMGRAFQYAGARSVLVSLWKVEDESSSLLAQAFLEGMAAGRPKLEALQSARQQVRQSGYEHPFFWAPFVLIGGDEVAGTLGSRATAFYHYDALGSTRALTNSAKTTTDTADYRAFGLLNASSGSTTNPFRWVGQLGYYWQPDTDDHWVRARIYRPQIGRWVSRDPLLIWVGGSMYDQQSRLQDYSAVAARHELGMPGLLAQDPADQTGSALAPSMVPLLPDPFCYEHECRLPHPYLYCVNSPPAG